MKNLKAEKRLATLPKNAQSKTVDAHKEKVNKLKDDLLKVQQQRDMYHSLLGDYA